MKKAAVILGKILLGILAFILCLALFVSTVLTVVVADVRIITDKDNINTLVTGYLTGKSMPQRNSVVTGIPLQANIHRAPNRNLADFDISMMGDTNFLVEFIYNTVKEEMGEDLPISLQEVQEFVEESTLDEFITEKGSSLISDFITGENTTTITIEEIEEQLKQNAPLIEETFQIPIDETVLTEMTGSIEESGILEKLEEGGLEAILDLANPPSGGNADLEIGTPSVDKDDVKDPSNVPTNKPVTEKITLMDAIEGLINGQLDLSTLSVPQLLNLFRSAISLETLLACIGLCVVLMGLIFLTQWKRYYSAMVKIGITLLVTGLICMIPAVFVWVAPELVAEMLGEMGFAKKLIDMIVQMTYPVPAGIAGGGLVLIVAGGILRGVAKKRAKAKAAGAIAVQTAAEPEVTEELSQELLEIAAEPEEAEDALEEVEAATEEEAVSEEEAVETPAEEETVEA